MLDRPHEIIEIKKYSEALKVAEKKIKSRTIKEKILLAIINALLDKFRKINSI